MSKRVKTGIPGFDEILYGGIPKRNIVLISGGPGVEHAADGVVRLDLDEIRGELRRSLIVWKMRGTRHSMKRHPFEITDKGIIVYHKKTLRVERGRIEEEATLYEVEEEETIPG